MLGKNVKDLQTGIVVADGEISGTLNYVTGYTGFNSSNVEEQKGNYLALKLEVEPEDAVTTVELVGGTKGSATLDEDMNIVLLIKDTETQTIKVTVTSDDETITEEYGLDGLTLEPSE